MLNDDSRFNIHRHKIHLTLFVVLTRKVHYKPIKNL